MKEKICKYFGHKFIVYSYVYTSEHGLEMHQLCTRCGYDSKPKVITDAEKENHEE